MLIDKPIPGEAIAIRETRTCKIAVFAATFDSPMYSSFSVYTGIPCWISLNSDKWRIFLKFMRVLQGLPLPAPDDRDVDAVGRSDSRKRNKPRENSGKFLQQKLAQ